MCFSWEGKRYKSKKATIIGCFFVCKEYKNIIQIESFNNILFANEGTAKKEKKALFGFISCFIWSKKANNNKWMLQKEYKSCKWRRSCNLY